MKTIKKENSSIISECVPSEIFAFVPKNILHLSIYTFGNVRRVKQFWDIRSPLFNYLESQMTYGESVISVKCVSSSSTTSVRHILQLHLTNFMDLSPSRESATCAAETFCKPINISELGAQTHVGLNVMRSLKVFNVNENISSSIIFRKFLQYHI